MQKGRQGWGRGSIEQRGPNTWVVRLSHKRDPATNKRVRDCRTVHGTRNQALRVLDKLRQQKDAHGPTPATAGRLTLDAWVRRRITTAVSLKTGEKLSPRTQAGQLDLWTRFSTPELRGTQLSDVTTATLKKHVADLRDRVSARTGRVLAARTVQIYANIIRAALANAVEDRVLTENPATGLTVHKGSVTSKVGQALTPEEMRAFLNHDPENRLAALWHVAAYTGARPGEVLALRWTDWDDKAGRLHIQRTLVRLKGREYFAPCKAGSARSVPVPAALRTVLLAHRFRQNGERAALDKDCPAGESKWVDASLMFTNTIGAALEAHNVAAAFRARLKAAGVRPVRWYDLRHSFGTHLVAQGVDAKTVAQLMGHKNVTTTLQNYTHPDEAAHRRAMDKLPYGAAPEKTG